MDRPSRATSPWAWVPIGGALFPLKSPLRVPPYALPFQYPKWVRSTKHWNYWRRGRDGRDGPPGCSCQSAGVMAGSPCDYHIYFVFEDYSTIAPSSLSSHMTLLILCKDEFLYNTTFTILFRSVQSRANLLLLCRSSGSKKSGYDIIDLHQISSEISSCYGVTRQTCS